jgi:hypothetical protein
MFWNRKPKLPITHEDKLWVDDSIAWVKTQVLPARHVQIKTVRPTTAFFDKKLNGTEEDAYFLFEKIKVLMDIETDDIVLEFFTDGRIDNPDGSVLSTNADLKGRSKSAAGYYTQDSEEIKILIETQQLKNPTSLIATIAHELAHFILLGENRIDPEDEMGEYLTDLLAVFYGFGIFMGNSKFHFNSNNMGWSIGGQGYLPEQVIAYATASLALERGEDLEFKKFFNTSMLKYFEQCVTFLESKR